MDPVKAGQTATPRLKIAMWADDPWTKNDSEPGDFDEDLSGIDPRFVERHPVTRKRDCALSARPANESSMSMQKLWSFSRRPRRGGRRLGTSHDLVPKTSAIGPDLA